MTNTSQPIIFFGTEDFSAVALERLLGAGFPVAAVVTKPDSRKGRGRQLSPPRVKVIAEAHGVPVWQPPRLAEIAGNIAALGSPAGVLVSYGKIIPNSIIGLFTPGIINVHPSLLPRYRGPSPIESAISRGDAETGVSIMQLSAEMDAGPVYARQAVALTGHETRPELYEQLGRLGADMLVSTLPRILAGELQPVPQDDSRATYCQLLTKSDAPLRPESQPAAACERQIRAHLGFPRTKFTVFGVDVIITSAHVSDTKDTPLAVECLDRTYLSIDELIAPSGKKMNAEAFIRGYSR